MEVWRGPRRVFDTSAVATDSTARHRRALGRRHLPLALVASLPAIVVVLWLWIDSPSTFERFAGRFILAGLLYYLFMGLSLRLVRRRALDDVRVLTRVLRRIETGDFDGALPRFREPDVARLARDCVDVGRRMQRAEEMLAETKDRARREILRNEAQIESVQSENARLRSEAAVLHGFGGILNRTQGPPQICSELITNIPDKVAYDRAIVYLLDVTSEKLVPQAIRDEDHPLPLAGNFVKDTPAGRELSLRSVAGWVAQTGKVLRVGDTRSDVRCTDLGDSARSVLAVPLRGRQAVLGVLQIEHPSPNIFDRSDERLVVSLANHAAAAVENVRLFEEAAKVQALRELDRLKSELLSTVSHELRTPLASIKGYAGTLLRDDVEWEEETRREFLQIIDEESDRLGELIEDLLQMSQIEAGILRVDLRSIRLPRLVQRVVKKARSSSTGHHFEVELENDFPDVRADPRRIEQVLRNLVENAVKYSPEGGTVRVRGDVEGGMARIAVSDEGIGIAPEDLARVFDRFYRADGDAVRRAGGTGLGLSICQGIVQMHGGQIWAESRLGAGSTFLFSIPLAGAGGAGDATSENEEDSE